MLRGDCIGGGGGVGDGGGEDPTLTSLVFLQSVQEEVCISYI